MKKTYASIKKEWEGRLKKFIPGEVDLKDFQFNKSYLKRSFKFKGENYERYNKSWFLKSGKLSYSGRKSVQKAAEDHVKEKIETEGTFECKNGDLHEMGFSLKTFCIPVLKRKYHFTRLGRLSDTLIFDVQYKQKFNGVIEKQNEKLKQKAEEKRRKKAERRQKAKSFKKEVLNFTKEKIHEDYIWEEKSKYGSMYVEITSPMNKRKILKLRFSDHAMLEFRTEVHCDYEDTYNNDLGEEIPQWNKYYEKVPNDDVIFVKYKKQIPVVKQKILELVQEGQR